MANPPDEADGPDGSSTDEERTISKRMQEYNNEPKSNKADDSELTDGEKPRRFSEIDADPVDLELTLLNPEPQHPDLISDERHAQVLLGYAKEQLKGHRYVWARLKVSLWLSVRELIAANFVRFREDTDYLEYDGIVDPFKIGSPSEALDMERVQMAAQITLVDFFMENTEIPIIYSEDLDAEIAENLVANGLLSHEYLKNLPTRSRTPKKYKDGGVCDNRQYIEGKFERRFNKACARSKDPDYLEGTAESQLQRAPNYPERDYNLAPEYEVDAVTDILSICQDRMSKADFRVKSTMAIFHTALKLIMADFRRHYLNAGCRSDLEEDFGLRCTPDILNYERVHKLCRNRADRMLHPEDADEGPLPGPYAGVAESLAGVMYRTHDVLTKEEYERLRSPDAGDYFETKQTQ